jgi:hypothetical protein
MLRNGEARGKAFDLPAGFCRYGSIRPPSHSEETVVMMVMVVMMVPGRWRREVMLRYRDGGRRCRSGHG